MDASIFPGGLGLSYSITKYNFFMSQLIITLKVPVNLKPTDQYFTSLPLNGSIRIMSDTGGFDIELPIPRDIIREYAGQWVNRFKCKEERERSPFGSTYFTFKFTQP
jgi:hypothetical protein